jgi:hypothetical protein
MFGALSQERGAKRNEKENRDEKFNSHVNCNLGVVEALVPSAYLIK